MAFARKCDRCNALYEPITIEVQRKDVNAIILIDKDFDNKYWNRGTMDLCPQCLEDLNAFLTKYKKER